MPTILRIGPYRFLFYSSDGNEPVHIHVRMDDKMAKFWVDPVRLSVNIGFTPRQLNEIEKLVEQNQPVIERQWHEFFGEH